MLLVDQNDAACARCFRFGCDCCRRDFGTLYQCDPAGQITGAQKISFCTVLAVNIFILARRQAVGKIEKAAEFIHHRNEHDLLFTQENRIALRHTGILCRCDYHDRGTELCLICDHAGIGIFRNRRSAERVCAVVRISGRVADNNACAVCCTDRIRKRVIAPVFSCVSAPAHVDDICMQLHGIFDGRKTGVSVDIASGRTDAEEHQLCIPGNAG